MKKTNYYTILGNIFICIALVGLLVLFYPLVQIYFFPKTISEKILLQGEYVVIPKIRAQANIIENIDPWKEAEYKPALKKGVALAKGSALPGEKGTMFLFAHSSGLPWELLNNNAPFLRLGELQKGDVIEVTKNKKRYIYHVTDKKIVWPTDTQYLTKQNKNDLVLQTCTPIGTSLQRLLIFAKLQAA